MNAKKFKIRSLKSDHAASRCGFNDLPNELLFKIFSHLCLRDLGRVEMVSRRLNRIARQIWSRIDELTFNKRTLFGLDGSSNCNNNTDSTNFRPVLAEMSINSKQFESKYICKIFKRLLCKKLKSDQLKYLDLSSDYSSELRLKAAECIELIALHCPNLIYLNLAEFQTEKKRFLNSKFVKFTQLCVNLVEINLSNSPINDSKAEFLFKNCTKLEIVNFSLCQNLTGQCFEHVLPTLKSISINKCYNIKEKYLLVLFERSAQSLTKFYAKDLNSNLTYFYSDQVMKSMVDNLNLSLSELDFTIKQQNFHLDQLYLCQNLTKLDLSKSFLDSKKLSIVLNQLKRLKCLDLSHSQGLNDDLFTLQAVNSPLEHLDLTNLNDLSDLSLESLIQNSAHLKKSLRKLEIASCSKFTKKTVLNLINSLDTLEFLNLSDIINLDNEFLYELFNSSRIFAQMEARKLNICAHFVQFDVVKFLEVKNDLKERICLSTTKLDALYEITYKNLTIEIDV